jgi:benzoyl-CoA-dihydrodiol lyase
MKFDRDARVATLTVRGPEGDLPQESAAIRELGCEWWPMRAFRELDDALCHIRLNEEEIGLVLVKTEGSSDRVLAVDETLQALRDDWFVGEVRHLIARTLRRLDLTARSLFALIEPGSCFAGTLLELALASDRSYMLDDPDNPVEIAVGTMNIDAYPMTHGPTRLAVRFLGDPDRLARILEEPRVYDAADSDEAGLVTVVADDIDYEDEVRLAVEERASLSPDALTGMEASLRFPGAEGCDSKIFGRLSAWQNWIFQRPNAVGQRGALTLYGKPERPSFDYRRT